MTTLAALPGLLGLWPASLTAQTSAPSSSPIEIRHAEFVSLERPSEAALVTLPDTWAQRGQSVQGHGRYVVQFWLADAPHMAVTWALWAERLSVHHAVLVNDRMVHDTRDVTPDGVRRPVPTLMPVPGALLRSGRNVVEVIVEAGERAGLSTLHLGLLADLQPQQQRYLRWRVELPEGLNAAAAGVAAFMVWLWVLRPQEVRIGCFGGVALLACLRNLAYFSVSSALPGPWTSGLFFLAQVASAGLFGLFALVQTGQQLRGYVWALSGVVLLGLMVGPLAALTDTLPLARRWVYPLLLVVCLPALWLLLSQARRQHTSGLGLAPLVGWLLVLTAAAHDYAYQTGRVAITHDYALPLAVPVLVLAFAAVQWRRLMRGMNELDRLNADLEQRVAERTRELDAALQARTRFLAAASHDLRQPMATLTLLLGLLREQLPPQPRLQGLGERLGAALHSMSSLLEGLLDLSRLDSGRLQVQTQAVSLQPLLRSVAADVDEQALRKGLRLIQHPTRAVVLTDALLLEQIIRNLTGNAVQHTVHGGVLIGVRPCGSKAVRLVVQDTGPGISATDRERVFEAFVQLGNPGRERHKGLGLGLAIAQRSATLLDTTLELHSVVGRGSRFSLVLPLADTSLSTAPKPSEASTTMSATPKTQPQPDKPLLGCKVWLLEDDALLVEALILQLQSWGAQVRSFASVQALKTAADIPATNSASQQIAAPDLLLTDLRLPDGDGLDSIAWLRQRSPGNHGMCSLVLTGNTAPAELARLADSGLAVLYKPCSTAALQAALLLALSAKSDTNGT